MSVEHNTEKYLQRRPKQIIHSLRMLVKGRCLITGRFQTGKYSFLTVIVDVVPDKNVLILDYGHNEALNNKVLDASYVVFITRYNGIRVRFSTEKIEKHEYQGRSVFVIPIPESLFWQERREFYRVKLPIVSPAVCQILQSETVAGDSFGNLEFRAANIGPVGIALILPAEKRFSGEIGAAFEHCSLLLPDHNEAVDLELRHKTPIDANDDQAGWWLGFAFLKPGQSVQSRILQYMQFVERQRKEFER